jgi:hypothetical protein
MAKPNPEGGKFSPDDVKKHVKKIREAVEKHRKEKKGEHFTAITPEEVERKLRRVNSPMIVSQAWGPAPPGGNAHYSVGIYNPDPVAVNNLFVHVWIGSGNVDPVVGTFLLNVDPRFPRLTEPPAFGLSLAPGAWSDLTFSIAVPATVQQSNYIGNSCLMQLDWHDMGKYLDRGVFVFQVT